MRHDKKKIISEKNWGKRGWEACGDNVTENVIWPILDIWSKSWWSQPTLLTKAPKIGFDGLSPSKALPTLCEGRKLTAKQNSYGWFIIGVVLKEMVSLKLLKNLSFRK